MDEILNTIMGRIPRPSNPFASRRWKTFSVADWNAAEMEKGGLVEWREWKDRGNALFQEKDYAGARAMYGKARLLALGPYRSGAVKAWFDALQAAPAHTARRQVFDIEPLVGQVLKYLPRTFSRKSPLDGKPYGAPNNAAAVCSANLSAAWLLDGEPKKALEHAKRATRMDPGYIKAHRRELNALQALHRRQAVALRELKSRPELKDKATPRNLEAMRKQLARFATAIKEKNEELADYEQARAAYPTEALALLTAGWLDHEQASFVYGPVRFLECVTWLRDGPLKKMEKVRSACLPCAVSGRPGLDAVVVLHGGGRHGQRDQLPGLDNGRQRERRPGGQATAGRRVSAVVKICPHAHQHVHRGIAGGRPRGRHGHARPGPDGACGPGR